MRIGVYHGYELTGSGSNEYTRYLARALAREGHDVHVLCREPRPEALSGVRAAYAWDAGGESRALFSNETDAEGAYVVHQLPHGDIRPVYLTDKQREGDVKAFASLTDAELRAYHDLNVTVVRAVLRRHPLDVLHANHVLYQPVVARDAAGTTPYIVFPHGSSIEYTLRGDDRYRAPVLEALDAAQGIITGSLEVQDRILDLYPEHKHTLQAKMRIVGVGVDTSVFKPVERAERRNSIRRLSAGGGDGKRPEQTRELRERLDRGELDAVRDYYDAYNHSQPDADLVAKLASIPWEGSILLFVGALTAGKGLQSLIAALPALLRRVPDTHLVVVGSGAYRETLEALTHAIASGNAALLEKLAARGWDFDRSEKTGPWKDVQRCSVDLDFGAGFSDHVHFVGRLDHDRLRHLFPCADAAVFPSLVSEAYPLVLMEALANGVPPAVTDFSGFHDGLETLEPLLGADWVDRFRLPVDAERRVDGIVEALAGLLEHPDREVLKLKLRAVAVEHFDWQVRARQMVDAYKDLMSARRGPAA